MYRVTGTVRWPSLALGSDGLPVVAVSPLFANPPNDVAVVHCSNPTCTTTSQPSDIPSPSGNGGSYPSLVIGPAGNPVVAHRDSGNGHLYLAWCRSSLTCANSGSGSVVDDSSGNVGLFTSMAIAPDGTPVLTYLDAVHHALRYAHCDGRSATLSRPSPSLRPWAGSATTTSPQWPSARTPCRSSRSSTTTVKHVDVLHCRNLDCNGHTTVVLDRSGDDGSYDSMTIGSDGLPFLAYRDYTNGRLKATHCSNVFCTPYARAR